MASTPWTVTKRKRRSTPATANRPGKRARLSEAPALDGHRQQTLTQAQWIPSRPPSFLHETMARSLRPSSCSRNDGTMSKRDSTLTQMDFFSRMTLAPQDLDDAPLYENAGAARRLPQLDGTCDSPRKRRPRTCTAPKQEKVGGEAGVEESQEYRPSPKRKLAEVVPESPSRTLTRTSNRLSNKETGMDKVFSDPANSYEYFARALSRSPVKMRDTARPVLEVQDSTATHDDDGRLSPQSQRSTRSAGPRTPQRPRTVVLSSQSPESLPPTTGKRLANADVVGRLMRSPLGERSINLPPASIERTRKSRKKTRSQASTPKNSKIVSLKLRRTGMPPPKSRIEDSQNIWSLPLSSSPGKRLPSQQQCPATEDLSRKSAGRAPVRAPSNPTEIPGTSQTDHDEFESFEESAALPRILRSQNITSQSHGAGPQSHIASGEGQRSRSEVIVRDFAQQINPATVDDKAAEPWIHTPKKRVPAVIADSESDFDSPIANDTQFNEEVAQRTSSPRTVLEASHKTVSTEMLSAATATLKAAAASRHVAENHLDAGEEVHELPTPRLIRSSSRPPSRAEEVNSDPSSEEGLLPPPLVAATHTTQARTTRLPLNDTLPPSSPPLQSHRSITQRSMVRPASLPHPSQMSTQEATQYGMSSLVVDELSETPLKTERITIKDSSSIKLPLSQIPAHGGSQNGLDVELALDALDEDINKEELHFHPPGGAEREAPEVTMSNITRLASKRKAIRSPIQSPMAKRRRTPSQILLMRDDLDSSSSEEELDLDPRSSHRTIRPQKSIPQDPGGSQDHVSTASTTSNVPSARRKPSTTEGHAHDNGPNVLSKPTEEPRPASPTQPESIASSPPSSPWRPSPLQKDYAAIPGFNNETQSNFTQGGHVSAAYVHRQREKGVLPQWYTPKPFKVPGYTRR